jgi:two-component system cell cycle sensor histidine kinase/response regulator CckA
VNTALVWVCIVQALALAATLAWLTLQRRTAAARTRDLHLLRNALAAQQDIAAVGSLTAAFAHGANNRLTVILSSLDVIEAAGLANDDARTAATLANGAALRLADDMRSMLAGARRHLLQPRIVELHDAVASARQLFRQLPGGVLQVVADVPTGLTVRADPERLANALLQLLSFAQRRGASAVNLTGAHRQVEVRGAERTLLRKGSYICLDVEMVRGTLSERLVQTSPEPGHVLDRLLDPDGLELAAVEAFATALRGQLVAQRWSTADPRVQLYLPASEG